LLLLLLLVVEVGLARHYHESLGCQWHVRQLLLLLLVVEVGLARHYH
jgi:hypothetical protein